MAGRLETTGQMEAAMMIELKHRATGQVLRVVDAESLAGADLRDENLEGADLNAADLSGAWLHASCWKHKRPVPQVAQVSIGHLAAVNAAFEVLST